MTGLLECTLCRKSCVQRLATYVNVQLGIRVNVE